MPWSIFPNHEIKFLYSGLPKDATLGPQSTFPQQKRNGGENRDRMSVQVAQGDGAQGVRGRPVQNKKVAFLCSYGEHTWGLSRSAGRIALQNAGDNVPTPKCLISPAPLVGLSR